jgi:uncharacterized protein (TIGR00255 family)
MIRSMTGYGDAERATAVGLLRAEIRTVNHRFLSTSFRTPAGFDAMEPSFAEWIRGFVARGRVSMSLVLEPQDPSGDAAEDGVELDLARARRRVELLRLLKRELDLPGEVDVAQVARFGDIFRHPDPEEAGGTPDAGDVRAVIEEALRGVVAMRETEGRRLRADMEERLEALAQAVDAVAERAPERLTRERDRLRDAVRELTEREEVDEDRLAREIAYLAEKWDVNEEVVRFRSHLDAFREALGSDGVEPVGKRLSFLVQEMHREANTLGAKANDGEITAASVSMKEEIERLREQVENVE